MKLLIVHDEIEHAGLLGELLRMEDEKNRGQGAGVRGQGLEEVFLRTNLEEALTALPECDAVISDGNFLQHPRSRFAFDLWTSLFAAALQQGKRFVLYSGDGRCVQQAAALGISAFLKPALAEMLYAAIRSQESGVRSQNDSPEADATGQP